jgi:hypothetical protein
MERVKCRDEVIDRENEIYEAKHAYPTGLKPSIHTAASTYGIFYTTLLDRLRQIQPRGASHYTEQLLTAEEKTSILRFYETLDGVGYPLQGKMVKI